MWSSKGGVRLLIAMVVFTLATAISRLIVYHQYIYLSKIIRLDPGNVSTGDMQESLTVTMAYIADFDSILGITVSCIPILRAWLRIRKNSEVNTVASVEAGKMYTGEVGPLHIGEDW
jgi:hypothetical protein